MSLVGSTATAAASGGVGRPARQVPKEVGGEGDRYTGNGTAGAARSGGSSARERGLVEVKRRARVERRRAAVRVEHGLQNDARRRRGGLRDQNARRQCYPGDAVAHAREIIQLGAAHPSRKRTAWYALPPVSASVSPSAASASTPS